ncbi:MAG: hypothetical protein JW750_01405 [Anaerolineaceae bacterium]|nr:hypothetical protein [Anaerolineaceae bacterium]
MSICIEMIAHSHMRFLPAPQMDEPQPSFGMKGFFPGGILRMEPNSWNQARISISFLMIFNNDMVSLNHHNAAQKEYVIGWSNA